MASCDVYLRGELAYVWPFREVSRGLSEGCGPLHTIRLEEGAELLGEAVLAALDPTQHVVWLNPAGEFLRQTGFRSWKVFCAPTVGFLIEDSDKKVLVVCKEKYGRKGAETADKASGKLVAREAISIGLALLGER